jgi:Pyruvate/2-oxoacid:ferredoxin oxidoreductase delta subunit
MCISYYALSQFNVDTILLKYGSGCVVCCTSCMSYDMSVQLACTHTVEVFCFHIVGARRCITCINCKLCWTFVLFPALNTAANPLCLLPLSINRIP